MTTPPSAEPKSLTTLVQALPQELFDEIFELVTQVESGEVFTVIKAYHHPIALQTSSAIRRDQAEIYYTTNKFLAAEGAQRNAKRYMRKWLFSLSKHHRSMLREIRAPCWQATLDTLTTNGIMSHRDTLTLKEIQLLAIPDVRLALMFCGLGSGVSGDLVWKTDFKTSDGEKVWLNWRELVDLDHQLRIQ